MAKDKLNLYKKGWTRCFGCGRDNPIGLKLDFEWDGTTVVAEFVPNENHQGWPGLMHGGIMYALMDEAMSYVPYFWGLSTVTGKSEVRFRNPGPMGQTLIVKATGERKRSKVVLTEGVLSTKSGMVIAEGSALMYVISTDGQQRGVIWDLDGVIADTAKLHYAGWRDVFKARGVEFSWEDFMHTFGLRNDSTIRMVMGKDKTDSEIEVISNEKEEKFRDEARLHLEPFPGVISLMAQLSKHKFKQSIASSAPLENVELVLKVLGISQFFQAIVSAEDVSKGKPDPEVFLTAASKLGIKPECAVVVEDAVAGAQAAKSACMKCIAVTNTHAAEKLGQADLVVGSLEKVDVHKVEQLLVRPTGSVSVISAEQERR